MRANSVELAGEIELVDLPDVVAPDRAAHERIRKSRLADVMIVLERDAAEIAQAIGEHLATRWPGVREADVELTIAEDAPTFIARASAEHDVAADPVDRDALRAALAEVLESQMTEAIARRASVNRRFAPRVHLGQPTPPAAPGDEPAHSPRPTPASPAKRAAIQPAGLEASPAGRFWLVVLFGLIAAVLLLAAYLFVAQPG